MARFLTRYRITPDIYSSLKVKVLTGKSVQAIKEFRDMTGLSLQESRSAVLTEFKLEYKLSSDMALYACIQRIEAFEGINNLPIASDLGVLLEFARNQLCQGLNSNADSTGT